MDSCCVYEYNRKTFDYKTMKTTLKNSIISFILYVLLMITIFSCKTVNKVKTHEDFASKNDLSQLDQKWSNYLQTFTKDVKETTESAVNAYFIAEKESNSTNENESSVISGTITPGEKEKSVSIGGTTIKSDGVNVTFEIKSTKAKLQESLTQISELNQTIEKERNARISLENDFKEYKKQQSKVIDELKQEKSTQTKTVSKKGFTFWAIVICALVCVGYLVYRFRGRIPFLK